MLQLKSIGKSYHDGGSELRVLRDVDLQLRRGESLALRGASGSGKSTLLQIAAGLEAPDQGEVHLLGRRVASLRDHELSLLRRRHLGFVFQQFNLLPGLRVCDNILFQRRLNQLPDEAPWVAELIQELELDDLWRRPVEVLSGGQQQRIAIARALAHQPDLVFADEPTGNLHDTLSRQVMALFVRLVEKAGTALLLVTHNRDIAACAQRQCVLEAGSLIETGRPPEAAAS